MVNHKSSPSIHHTDPSGIFTLGGNSPIEEDTFSSRHVSILAFLSTLRVPNCGHHFGHFYRLVLFLLIFVKNRSTEFLVIALVLRLQSTNIWISFAFYPIILLNLMKTFCFSPCSERINKFLQIFKISVKFIFSLLIRQLENTGGKFEQDRVSSFYFTSRNVTKL